MLPVVSPSPSTGVASLGPAGTPAALADTPQASGGGRGGKSWLTIAGAVVLGLLALALGGYLMVTRRRDTSG